MNNLIFGGDGYLSLPTATHFAAQADIVWVVHNFGLKKWEPEDSAEPIMPILTLHHRVKIWNNCGVGEPIQMKVDDLAKYRFAYGLRETKPDAASPKINWTVGESTEDEA